MEVSQKVRSETILAAMEILNKDGLLIPGSREHEIVTEWISEQVDAVEPEKALETVEQSKDHLISQIDLMS